MTLFTGRMQPALLGCGTTASVGQRRRVLIDLAVSSWQQDMMAFAESLAASGRYNVNVLLRFSGPIADRLVDRCGIAGITTTRASKRLDFLPEVSTHARRSRLKRLLKRSSTLQTIAEFRDHLVGQLRALYHAKQILADFQPDVVVLGNFGGFGLEMALVKAAARRRIPVMFLEAYALVMPRKRAELRDVRLGETIAVSSRFRRALATLFPHWTFRFPDGRRIFIESPSACFAAELSRLMVRNPFLTCAGPITVYAVMNERSRTALAANDVDPCRIRLVGRASEDSAFALLNDVRKTRSERLKLLGLDPERPLVLCSSIPAAEHSAASWQEQLEFHEGMFRELAAVKGAQIALSLHPSQRDSTEIRALAERHKIPAFGVPSLNELLPLAFLFVYTESSTLTLSAACGVPVIAILFGAEYFPGNPAPGEQRTAVFRRVVANLRPPDFYISDGMVLLESCSGLAATIHRCLSEPQYYNGLVEGQRRAAEQWASMFDGHACERLVALADELTGQTPAVS